MHLAIVPTLEHTCPTLLIRDWSMDGPKMGRTLPEGKTYKTWEKVNLRGPLLKELDELVAEEPLIGGRPEALHTAVREFIERHRRPILPPHLLDEAVREYITRHRLDEVRGSHATK